MRLFILNVRLAKPQTAPRTTNRRRMMAWLMIRRHGLTQLYWVRGAGSFSSISTPLKKLDWQTVNLVHKVTRNKLKPGRYSGRSHFPIALIGHEADSSAEVTQAAVFFLRLRFLGGP